MGQPCAGGAGLSRMLLVDDDPGSLRLLEMAVAESGTPVETLVATDGEEALEILHRRGDHTDVRRPDIVVLDLDLPGVAGREVLREIRETDRLRSLPVVVLSQHDDREIIEECYRIGANAYLVKPEDYDGLREVVTAAISFWEVAETGGSSSS